MPTTSNVQTIVSGTLALAALAAIVVLMLTGHPVPEVVSLLAAAAVGGHYGAAMPGLRAAAELAATPTRGRRVAGVPTSTPPAGILVPAQPGPVDAGSYPPAKLDAPFD